MAYNNRRELYSEKQGEAKSEHDEARPPSLTRNIFKLRDVLHGQPDAPALNKSVFVLGSVQSVNQLS